MDAQFWEQKWEEGWTPFHRVKVNENLIRHHDLLLEKEGERILVPLCGKSLDLIWLTRHFHQVVGVEVVEKPIQDFFRENNIEYSLTEEGPFRVFKSTYITIFQGDFFEMTKEVAGPFDAFYDRASLVAIPPSRRSEYGEKLLHLLSPKAPGLLFTLEYDQKKMDGPPFSISHREVEEIFEPGGDVELMEEKEVIEDSPHLQEKGLASLKARVYKIIKRS